MSPTGRPENGPIYLVKKDNMLSEQNFLVTLQVMDSAPYNYGSSIQPALFGRDYTLSGISLTESFPTVQRRILFHITLLTDDVIEGTEAFQASVSPGENLTSNIAFLPSSTYIIIEDSDCILLVIIHYNDCIL